MDRVDRVKKKGSWEPQGEFSRLERHGAYDGYAYI